MRLHIKHRDTSRSHPQIPTIEQLSTERNRLNYQARYRKTLRSTVNILIVVAAIAVLLSSLFLPVLQISGSSMEPTLYDSDIIVLTKSGHYQPGALYGFYWQNKLLIKRLIGQPGDYIDIKEDGTVYVNGEVLQEPYLTDQALGECDMTFPYQVPENRYFFMGDLRSSSVDSRSSAIGSIEESQIVGRVMLRVWPFRALGFVK